MLINQDFQHKGIGKVNYREARQTYAMSVLLTLNYENATDLKALNAAAPKNVD